MSQSYVATLRGWRGPGDVDDLQPAAQRPGERVLLAAEPHELDVRAVLGLAGAVVLEVGDEPHPLALTLGLDLHAAGVGGDVAVTVGLRRERQGRAPPGPEQRGGRR